MENLAHPQKGLGLWGAAKMVRYPHLHPHLLFWEMVILLDLGLVLMVVVALVLPLVDLDIQALVNQERYLED
jgi:hypothetical protein